MSGAWDDRQRDRVLAVGTAVFAGTLIATARGIEDSMLSDAVGAGGVPQGVGIVMALAAVALFAKSCARGPVKSADDSAAQDDRAMGTLAIATRTAGLVALLVAYGLLLPLLGYALTVSLLVLAAGWLAGAPLKAPLLLFSVSTGPLLWALFDWALKVRMPVGSVWG